MQRFSRTHAFAAGLAGITLISVSLLSATAQTMPVNPATPKAGQMQTSPTTSAHVTAAPGDMMADKIQGLTVYTLDANAKPENKVAAPAHDAMLKTVTKDEFNRMTKGFAKVGEIDDIVVAPDGKVKDAVVSVGGFLGVGERNVALGWSDLTFVRTSEGESFAYIGKTKAELEKIPEFRPYK